MKHRWILLACVACGGAPTLMSYHRQTLDDMAQGTMECPIAELQFEDTTPEGFQTIGDDPETRRYTARGCEREAAFVCYTFRYMSTTADRPECRPLRQGEGAVGGVYVGPVRVGGDD